MVISCIWEHNGNDTLLYAANLPGAFTRGADLREALEKMPQEVRSYLAWANQEMPSDINIQITQVSPCQLEVRDADSDVLFETEIPPLTPTEYQVLKALALRSAADFERLYQSIPEKQCPLGPPRRTFYGQVPRSTWEMYEHTKNVNSYYFAEIEVDADNTGSILDCRRRGFEALEQLPNYLSNPIIEGSYGESWTLRKVLRRFLWHDRIHAKAMYRLALRTGGGAIPDPFHFSS